MSISSQQYANLADHTYGRDLDGSPVDIPRLVGKEVVIEGTKYKVLAHVDRPSGYQGTMYQRIDTGEIVVSHRGTEFGREPLKDGLLADGGMVVGRVNSQSRDAIEFTREALVRAQAYGLENKTNAPEVSVTGHSLGGTLAQISAHHFGLKGEAFNPYGAASLNYRIPEGPQRPPFVNHVMAADVVSAAAPQYGSVRMYATQGEILQLRASGYNNIPLVGGLVPSTVIGASINGSHMMHNFTNKNGDGRSDISILAQPDARTRATENERMIGRYRDDVQDVRNTVTVGGQVLDVFSRGPFLVPAKAWEKIRDGMQPDLVPGEPARLEQQQRGRKTSSIELNDMRDPVHPANEKYQQAYAGVCVVDKSLGRVPDASSERAAAALTANCAHMVSLDQVWLNESGNRFFARENARPGHVPQMGFVDSAVAVQQPVEQSTRQWQDNAQQLQLTASTQQQSREQDQSLQNQNQHQQGMARA